MVLILKEFLQMNDSVEIEFLQPLFALFTLKIQNRFDFDMN